MREKQKQRLIDYFNSGIKTPDNKKLGVELEHFIIYKDSLQTVNYFDEPGVHTILKGLENDGFPVKKENGYILQVDLPKGSVTLEPGSQFEFSIQSQENINQVLDAYNEMFALVHKHLPENQMLVNVGYHPVTTIEEIKILPKERYGHMFEYFKKRGTMAHNMMKGTGALQMSFDYFSEEDFGVKFQLLNRLTPIFYTIFDNVYRFQNEDTDERNLRMKIWENTDKDRSGIVKGSVGDSYSFSDFAEYILDNPMIFLDTPDHHTIPVGDDRFTDLFDPEKHSDSIIEHAVSIVFPDVRAKHYIEFRVMDSVPILLCLSCAAVLKGILYNEENLQFFSEKYNHIHAEALDVVREQSRMHGYDTLYEGETIQQHAQQLIEKAKAGLEENECAFLEPMQVLVEKKLSPRDVFEVLEKTQGLGTAVEAFSVREADHV